MKSPADIVHTLLTAHFTVAGGAPFVDPEGGGFVDPETGGAFIDPEAGLVLSETLYVSFLPDKPDEMIAIFDTAGRLDGRMMRTGEQIEHYGIQIQVRGKSYPGTYAKVRGIASFLDAVKKESVDMGSDEIYVLHNMSRSGAILPIGMETVADRRRYLFSLNYLATITQQSN